MAQTNAAYERLWSADGPRQSMRRSLAFSQIRSMPPNEAYGQHQNVEFSRCGRIRPMSGGSATSTEAATRRVRADNGPISCQGLLDVLHCLT